MDYFGCEISCHSLIARLVKGGWRERKGFGIRLLCSCAARKWGRVFTAVGCSCDVTGEHAL